nr:kynureninase [Kordiimonas aquimaris]
MPSEMTNDDAKAMDAADPLRCKRAEFHVPEGVIYLDGNSLGLLPVSVKDRVAETVENEWGNSLIRAWNSHSWMDLPEKVGAKIAKLIGAEEGTVVSVDTTSLNVAKAVSAAMALNPERKVILTDNGNFPTDIYMAQGIADLVDKGHEVRIVNPQDVYEALDETIAVMMITQVDYRTGRRHNMKQLTERAHAVGAITVWDLAHSAGAFEVDLTSCNVDLAVGCTYKYFNGGPGAPAFIYVAPRHQDNIKPILSGWIGHKAPFAFELGYQPAEGIKRMNVGTPPVIALSALDAALDVWVDVDMSEVRMKSVALSELFIAEVESRCTQFGLTLASPRDADSRGSQVSFRCPDGYAVMQALIAEGIIGDFRAPDIIRFGFTPLYLGYEDVLNATKKLEEILRSEVWREPAFMKREKVT